MVEASERRVPLPGRRTLTIRRAVDDDLPRLHALYDGLSVEDRHARFFAAFRPSDAFLRRWIGHHVLVAVDDEGTIVADGGYARLANGNAEFALTIAARWRGWLGPYLLDLLCADAADEGIPNLEGEILLTNGPMLAVVRTRGHAVAGHPDVGVVRVVFSTSGPAPSWPAVVPDDRSAGRGAVASSSSSSSSGPGGSSSSESSAYGSGAYGSGAYGSGASGSDRSGDVRSDGSAVAGSGSGLPGATDGGAPGVPGRGVVARRPRVLVEGAGGRWRYEDEARAHGFDVITCPGPAARVGARRCPLLEGGRCPLVDGADVIVAALPPSDERSARLRAAETDAGRTVVDAPPGDEGVLTTLCAILAP